jgi:uncharacterized protein YndB with AHSA1/START domain
MTRNKSFKGRVRARMGKTGERYASARRQLVAKAAAKQDPEAADAQVPGPEAPVRGEAEPTPEAPGAGPGVKRPYSDEVIRANTGKGWDEWFGLLDAWGGAERPHPEIARWLNEEHGVPGWWAQGVTVAYEQARGLRAPGQRRGGQFEVNASKTVAVPVERLYEAFADPALREQWLPGAAVEVRTARPARSIRANWDDGSTRLVIAFTARGESRSQVALTHERVPDAGTADKLKAFWRERMAALKQLLEG